MKTLLFAWVALTLSLHAETIHVVEQGKLTEHARPQGGAWKESDGAVRGGGTGLQLALDRDLDASEFEIMAVLALPKVGHTAAGIYLGREYFGFDGKDSAFFTEGGAFKTQFFAGPAPRIEPGRDFTFKAVAREGKITFSIDGQAITTQPYAVGTVSSIALRPHRGEMVIRDFRVTGTFPPREPLPFLFACGEDGYKSYRIPALVRTPRGTLLAFAEGRKHHAGDHGDIDLVMKRSTDHGRTWSKLEVVFDHGDHVAGNPCPVVDEDSGRIFLLSCTSETSEHELMQGKGRRAIWIQTSDDDGKTWSRPRDISPGIYPDTWRWYATGPCSGIQIRQGAYKGRLVVPANHSVFEAGRNTYRSHCLYSDDGGRTWKLGESAGPGSNESQIAEAGENLLYQNMRMQSHGKGVRAFRYSEDGGATWTDLEHDPALKCPVCQGSVIRDYSAPHRLIFSNPATGGRNGMTIRVSEDGGKTWPFHRLVRKTSSAYSDLVITADDRIGILYEGGYRSYSDEGIIFQRFSREELFQCEATTPEAKMNWDIWKERFEMFNARARQGEIDLLLVGDSITHYWQKNRMCATDGQRVWDRHFSGMKAANFGIGSDRTQHVLYRMLNGNLEGIQPKAVVLMIGTNNTTSQHTPDQIYLGTQAIIKVIQEKCPDTTILLYEIFPRLRDGRRAWENGEAANRLTDALCDGRRVIRCSINRQLLNPDGQPDPEIFFDGIHISEKGYEIWADDILKHYRAL